MGGPPPKKLTKEETITEVSNPGIKKLDSRDIDITNIAEV